VDEIGAIVARAKNGDRAAFKLLIETHHADLFRLAYSVLGNHHDAEDALQDTYINAYRALPKFRGDADPGSWLYRIALNRSIDLRRRRGKLVTLSGSGEDAAQQIEPVDVDPAGDPERGARSRNIRAAVAQSLDRLSPSEYRVFVLRHYGELSLAEIAEVSERAIGTVKNLLFRAVRKVRNDLETREITPEEVP